MNQDWNRCWILRLVSGLIVGGAISSYVDCTFAQIVPDRTLGVERSIVIPIPGGIDVISGGATRGTNLFHSFSQFSVLTGRIAYFNNAANIQNIISRVTGASVSNIDGLIAANGKANVFLINPNGIIFGPNASLYIGGSFVASTARSLKFADGTEFSATTPQTSPLLTISVPIGLQFGGNPGGILNQSQAIDLSSGNTVGLQVMSGQTLALVGGNISFNNGMLQAPGGRVELGGLAEAGTVGLNFDAGQLKLSFPNDVARADVSLTNGSEVNVSAGGGGSIVINAQNLNLAGDQKSTVAGESKLLAGIASGEGSVNSQAGDIDINVTRAFTLNNGSSIANTVGSVISDAVQSGAQGKGGNVNITTGSLLGTNGSQVFTFTAGNGDAGSITINASGPVSFDGAFNSNASGVSSQVSFEGVGKGGDVSVTAGSLSLTNGAELSTTSFTGAGGNLTVNAPGFVELSGYSGDLYTSSKLSTTSGVSERGNLTINTGRLIVQNGASIGTAVGFSQVDQQAASIQKGGALTVNASDSVELLSGSSLGAANFGPGIGGDLTIITKRLSVRDGASISTSASLGAGQGGNINVIAPDSVELVGRGLFLLEDSSIPTLSTDTYSIGNAGNINITTGRLLVQGGASVSASTFGSGAGGILNVNAAKSVELIGTSTDGRHRSSLLTESTIAPGSLPGRGVATGNAGDINITTGQLLVQDGAEVSASTSGSGMGGILNVNAAKSVELIGTSANGQFRSSLLTESSPLQGSNEFEKFTGGFITNFGNAGNLRIATKQLSVQNGAQVSVSSQASGDAGILGITTSNLQLDNQAALTANSVTGKGGDIQLQATDLLILRHNSLISAVSGQIGSNGIDGNINVDSNFLVAFPLENSHIVATGYGRSPGSNIQVNAQGIFGIQYEEQLTPISDIVATGTVNLNTPQVNPSRGLVALPAVVIDPSERIVQGCAAGNGTTTGSQFTVTGRGGLPPNPGEVLSRNAVLADTRLPTTTAPAQRSVTVTPASPKLSTLPAPATGAMFNSLGQVTLIAATPTARLEIPWLAPHTCHVN